MTSHGEATATARLRAVVAVRRLALDSLLLVLGAGALVASTRGFATRSSATWVDLDALLTPLVLPLMVAVVARPALAAWAAVAGAVLAGPVRALVYDPFLDASCDRCGHGGLVVWPHPGVADALSGLGAMLVLVAVGLGLWRGPRTLALYGVGACWALGQVGVAGRAPEAVAVGFGVLEVGREVWIGWRRRRQALGLVAALEEGRDLTSTLRTDLADPRLLVAFPDPDGGGEVDSRGDPVRAALGQLTTELLVGGTVLGRVHHAASTRLPDLEQALDATARLMLVNEQLTAQLAARVRVVTEARQLVVERAVADRRALERDLHDGIQQQLLALSLDLRLALAEQPDVGLERAVSEVQRAFDDVREVSHGVHPPLLATRGLAAAATSLVRRHGSGTELVELPEARFADRVEEAAFAVVAEAVARGACRLRVSAGDGVLCVRAEGVGHGVDGVLPDLVAAVGGRLSLAGPTIEAAIPCGS